MSLTLQKSNYTTSRGITVSVSVTPAHATVLKLIQGKTVGHLAFYYILTIKILK